MFCEPVVVSFKESKPSRFCLQHPIGARLVVHAIIWSVQNSIDRWMTTSTNDKDTNTEEENNDAIISSTSSSSFYWNRTLSSSSSSSTFCCVCDVIVDLWFVFSHTGLPPVIMWVGDTYCCVAVSVVEGSGFGYLPLIRQEVLCWSTIKLAIIHNSEKLVQVLPLLIFVLYCMTS